MASVDQQSVYYVAFDAKGRAVSATGREDIAREDARSGGRVLKVLAPHVFAARRAASEALLHHQ